MLRCALTTAFTVCCLAALPAAAQPARAFPADALRGEMSFGAPPQVSLNGRALQLAPGARIRGQDNMIRMSASLVGETHVVHYTLDMLGQPRDIWLLRPQEAARTPWPTTPQQAQQWQFDPAAQAWTRP